MLNRRFLRIKVMQMLYSFFQHENADVALFEKELFKSLDKVYNLYIYVLALFTDLHHNALMVIDEHKNKRLPTAADLNPNLKFVNNSLLVALTESKELKTKLKSKKFPGKIIMMWFVSCITKYVRAKITKYIWHQVKTALKKTETF